MGQFNMQEFYNNRNNNLLNAKRIDKSEKDEFLPLSHWLRREILLKLKDEDLTFTNLLKSMNDYIDEDIGKSRLHQHLEVLVNGKFLRRYREDGKTLYVLNPDKFKELSEYFDYFLK